MHQREVNSPIVLLKLENKFDVIVLVDGGGVTGQAGAIRLGVARALNSIDRDANHAALKKAGFLTPRRTCCRAQEGWFAQGTQGFSTPSVKFYFCLFLSPLSFSKGRGLVILREELSHKKGTIMSNEPYGTIRTGRICISS